MNSRKLLIVRLLVDPELYNILLGDVGIAFDFVFGNLQKLAENDGLVLDGGLMEQADSLVVLDLPDFHTRWKLGERLFQQADLSLLFVESFLQRCV